MIGQQVEDSLQALTTSDDALVIALPKAAGQREFRWRFTRVDGSGEIPPDALQPGDFHPDQIDPEIALPARLIIARSEFEALCERISQLEERLTHIESLQATPEMDAPKD